MSELMSKDKAIAAMRIGMRVSHRFFTDEEWMCIKDGRYEFEDGCKCSYSDFWSSRTDDYWLSDWRIVANSESEGKKFIVIHHLHAAWRVQSVSFLNEAEIKVLRTNHNVSIDGVYDTDKMLDLFTMGRVSTDDTAKEIMKYLKELSEKKDHGTVSN